MPSPSSTSTASSSPRASRRRAGPGVAGARRTAGGGRPRRARRRSPGPGAGARADPPAPPSGAWWRRSRPTPGYWPRPRPRSAGPSASRPSAPWRWCRERRPTSTALPCGPRRRRVWRCEGPAGRRMVGARPDHGTLSRPAGVGAATAGRCGSRSTPCGPEQTGVARDAAGTMARVASYTIRLYGDPVLRQRAAEVEEVDGRLKQLADRHGRPPCTTLRAWGWPLLRSACRSACSSTTPATATAPRGRQPGAVRGRGEWTYDEGCLSVPGAVVAHRPPQGGPPHRLRPRRHGRSLSKPMSSWPGCSSTRSTTSTASCWSSASTTTSARRPSGSSGPAPWASPTTTSTVGARPGASARRPRRHVGL